MSTQIKGHLSPVSGISKNVQSWTNPKSVRGPAERTKRTQFCALVQEQTWQDQSEDGARILKELRFQFSGSGSPTSWRYGSYQSQGCCVLGL